MRCERMQAPGGALVFKSDASFQQITFSLLDKTASTHLQGRFSLVQGFTGAGLPPA